jgi:hypothetical protein
MYTDGETRGKEQTVGRRDEGVRNEGWGELKTESQKPGASGQRAEDRVF